MSGRTANLKFFDESFVEIHLLVIEIKICKLYHWNRDQGVLYFRFFKYECKWYHWQIMVLGHTRGSKYINHRKTLDDTITFVFIRAITYTLAVSYFHVTATRWQPTNQLIETTSQFFNLFFTRLTNYKLNHFKFSPAFTTHPSLKKFWPLHLRH